MKRDLFISHASADVDAAELLVDALERRGLRCWIATHDIAIGQDYAESIIDGIRSSRALVTLLSRAAITSRNVTREVERAHALDLALLTVRLEDVKPSGSLEYFLASRQFIDAFPLVSARADQVAASVHEVLGARQPDEQPQADEAGPSLGPANPLSAVSSYDNLSRRTMLLVVSGVVAAIVLGAIILATRPSSETALTSPSSSSTQPTGEQTATTATVASTSAVTPTSNPEIVGDGGTDVSSATAPGRFDDWVSGLSADPLRSRNWASLGPMQPPSVAWRLEDPISGAPVASDGVMYAAFQDQTLRAIDFETGDEIWLRETGFGARTPTVTGDALFYTDEFDVVAVDLATGANELLRIAPPPDLGNSSFPESPTIVAGSAYIVYLGLDDGVWTSRLVAVDLDTGAILWQWGTTSGRALLPVMVTEDIVVVIAELEVHAFERDTGVERWSQTLTGDGSPNMALIADDALIVRDTRLRALELTDGSQRWSTADSSLQYASVPGLIFTQSLDVHAVDSSNGSETWATRWTSGLLLSDAISIGTGAVYTHGSSSGAVGAYDLTTGAELWTIKHDTGLQPGIPMVVHNGLLVAVEMDRQLVAFR